MITVKRAKELREEFGFTHLIIFGVDKEGNQHLATHGNNKINAEESAKAGNIIKENLGWPKDLCNSKPLERICNNCDFWEPLPISTSLPIPEHRKGQCTIIPGKVSRLHDDPACRHLNRAFNQLTNIWSKKWYVLNLMLSQ